MVSIGGCDYCGEFCAGLGVNAVENFDYVEEDEFDLEDDEEVDAHAEAEVNKPDREPSRSRADVIEQHEDLVNRRLACAESNGDDYEPSTHVGPWHDAAGKALATCHNCSDGSQMDLGGWDTSLDHAVCLDCWAKVAGGMVLRKRRQASAGHVAATTAEPSGSDEAHHRVELSASGQR